MNIYFLLRHYLYLAFASAVVIAAFLPNFASAVTVSPGKLEYRVDPGAVINGAITLINDSDSERVFHPEFEKFTEVDGEKVFSPGEPTALTGWFEIPKSITLGPREQRKIPFTINVPENAPPGGHFAVMWWSAMPSGGQVSIVTRAGIVVYLQVSGDVNESGELTSFSTENNRFFFFSLPENFTVQFRNAGNTYLKPKGEIAIKNILGSRIADFGVNDVNIILLPAGNANLRITKHFDKAPFALGFYKAELALQWGDKPELVQRSKWFFVFPWKHVLATLLILAAVFFGARTAIRKYNKWIIAKYTSNLK